MFLYKQFEIKTNLSTQQITQRLQNLTEDRKRFRFSIPDNHKYFEGNISDNGFIVNEVSSIRSKKPVIKGAIIQTPKENIVSISLKPTIEYMVMCLFWISFVFYINSIKGLSPYGLKIPVIFTLFLITIVAWDFHNQYLVLKKNMVRLFKDKEV